jgi:hypothetical protein
MESVEQGISSLLFMHSRIAVKWLTVGSAQSLPFAGSILEVHPIDILPPQTHFISANSEKVRR